MQSVLHFITKMLSVAEVMAVCKLELCCNSTSNHVVLWLLLCAQVHCHTETSLGHLASVKRKYNGTACRHPEQYFASIFVDKTHICVMVTNLCLYSVF